MRTPFSRKPNPASPTAHAAAQARNLRFYPFRPSTPDVSIAEAIVRFDHALGARPTHAMLSATDYEALMLHFGFEPCEVPSEFRLIESGKIDLTIRPGDNFVSGYVGVTR